MAETFSYALTYGGVPFVLDDIAFQNRYHAARWENLRRDDLTAWQPGEAQRPVGQSIKLGRENVATWRERLLAEVIDNYPCVSPYPGQNISRQANPDWYQMPRVELFQYFYPSNASRWSRFVGLATTEQKDAMIEAGGLTSALTFIILCQHKGQETVERRSNTISTSLYMLPPRPLAVHYNRLGLDGLWIVELVDERYFWQQYKHAGALTPGYDKTWSGIIGEIATAMDISLSVTADSVYLYPDQDAQWWSNYESGPRMLDAALWNIGKIFIRNLDGTYSAVTASASGIIANSNREEGGKVVRLAGGQFGEVGPGQTAQTTSKAILPAMVRVTFPEYVTATASADPNDVPHYLNPRYTKSPRGTVWIEDSYGKTSYQDYTAAECGYTGGSVAGMIKVIHTTAKALYAGESSSSAENQTELTALGLQLATDFYNFHGSAALDEHYPGIIWSTVEGIHDVVWTYSTEQASTRVFRYPWIHYPSEFQHRQTDQVLGVGGRSVPLTVRLIHSGVPETSIVKLHGINLISFQQELDPLASGIQVVSGVVSKGLAEARIIIPNPDACIVKYVYETAYIFVVDDKSKDVVFVGGGDTTAYLTEPSTTNGFGRGWGVHVRNSTNFVVSIVGILDGRILFKLFPNQSINICSDASTGYVGLRGREIGGIRRTETNTDLHATDYGKMVIMGGAGLTTIANIANQHRGFKCQVTNLGPDQDAYTRWARGSSDGTYDYIPWLQGGVAHVPEIEDALGNAGVYGQFGLTMFGAKVVSANYTATWGDQGRTIAVTAGDTITLPGLPGDNNLYPIFALNVQNHTTGVVKVQPEYGLIDTKTVFYLLPRKGMWFFAGTDKNYHTERGRRHPQCKVVQNGYTLVTDDDEYILWVEDYGQDAEIIIPAPGLTTFPLHFSCDIHNASEQYNLTLRGTFIHGTDLKLKPCEGVTIWSDAADQINSPGVGTDKWFWRGGRVCASRLLTGTGFAHSDTKSGAPDLGYLIRGSSDSTSLWERFAPTVGAVMRTDTTGLPGWTNTMTDGQIPIGDTGGTPEAANITSSDSSVTITNGANTIDLVVSATGGSNPLLDGVRHTDTVAQTVSRGSLVYGNSTPKWDKLTIGGANTVLVSNGTDPSWGQVNLTSSSAVTGTLSANYITKWNSSDNALTDSSINDDGTRVSLTATILSLNGTAGSIDGDIWITGCSIQYFCTSAWFVPKYASGAPEDGALVGWTGTAGQQVAAGTAGNPVSDFNATDVTVGDDITVAGDSTLNGPTNMGTSSETNDSAGTLAIGTPVYVESNGGINNGDADSSTTALVTGLAQDTIGAGAAGDMQSNGTLTATTGVWDARTGDVGGLTPGSRYYLSSTAGGLTTTRPTTAGQFVNPIGVALSTTKMLLRYGPIIKL